MNESFWINMRMHEEHLMPSGPFWTGILLFTDFGNMPWCAVRTDWILTGVSFFGSSHHPLPLNSSWHISPLQLLELKIRWKHHSPNPQPRKTPRAPLSESLKLLSCRGGLSNTPRPMRPFDLEDAKVTVAGGSLHGLSGYPWVDREDLK